MRPKLSVAAILGVILLFAPGGMRAAGAPTDACSLLTQAQVSAALGVKVGAGEHLTPKATTLCGWNESGQTAPSDKRVMTAIETTKAFGYEKVPFQGITKTPLSGVGDDAIYITTPGFGTGLSVKKGDIAFKVRVYGFPPEQVKEKEKELALEVLANL
jgi:hypothetical protein